MEIHCINKSVICMGFFVVSRFSNYVSIRDDCLNCKNEFYVLHI